MNPKFKQIVGMFRRLPGVGPRQAARFVMALLEKSEQELEELGTAIYNLKSTITFCTTCFNLSENHSCSVCRDERRDKEKILVVEKVYDLDSIEKTGLYKGLYHVLGGALNPIDGVTPETLRIKELDQRIQKSLDEGRSIELILAMNPTTAGETTALYLKDKFSTKPSMNITRLARGLASGSHLEYADETTLRHALHGRK